MKKIIKLIVNLSLIITSFFVFSKSFFVKANEHTHEYENGICDCGDYLAPKYHQHTNTGWIVSNAGELLYTIDKYNSGESMKNIYITSDIKIPDNITWVPLGNSTYPFAHNIYTYDGRYQTIDLGNQTVNSSNYGFIGITSDTSTVKIENISILGNFEIAKTIENVGAVIGNAKGDIVFTNVSSHVNITTLEESLGSSKIGGLVGSSSSNALLKGVINYGDISVNHAYDYVGGIVGLVQKGEVDGAINYGNVSASKAKYLGGIIGYVDNESFNGLKNSLNIGKVSGTSFEIDVDGTSKTITPASLIGYLGKHASSSITNNYYLDENPFGVVITEDALATKVSLEDVKNGRIAYLLSEHFGQRIDDLEENTKDEYPLLNAPKVYLVYECDGKTIKYSNFNKNTDHEFKYHVDENKVIQTCENCDIEKYIELVAPENIHFDKTVKSATLKTNIEGLDVSSIEISYDFTPLFPGTYNASFTYLGQTATLSFEVLKGIPTKDMFTLLDTGELIYDGNKKEPNLITTSEVGMGEVYYKVTKDGKTSELVNAGTYLITFYVTEGKYYQAYEFSGLEFSSLITIKPKEVTLEWTKTTLFYEEGVNIYTPKYKLIGLCYQDDPIGSFSDIGTGVGKYTTTISLIDSNYILVGSNLTTEFIVKGILVPTPKIKPAVTNGNHQVPEVQETEYYTVVENNGGKGVGNYKVVLELKDPTKYTWETIDDSRITLYFSIHQFASNWVEYPSMPNWVYGEPIILPTYKVDNGYLDMLLSYRKVGGEFSKTIPTEVGEYEVKLTSETNDLRAIPLDDVILKFSIVKATPSCTIDSVINVNYGVSLNDITLLGLGDGKWVYKNPGSDILNAGAHSVEVEFIPTNEKNYERVTKEVLIVVNKVDVLFNLPLVNDSLVYSNKDLALVIPASAIGGDVYYKVNDGQWSKQVPLARDAGVYTVYYKVVADQNHLDIKEEKLTVEIKKANITITATNLEIEQYETLPTFTYTVEGMLNNDSLEKEPLIKVNITDTKEVGTYEIIVSDAISNNYNITYQNAVLTIKEHLTCVGGTPTCSKKAVCILCNKEYGDTLPHAFNEEIKNENGTLTLKCSHCDEIKEVEVNTNAETNQNPLNPIVYILIGSLCGVLLVVPVFLCLYFFVIKKQNKVK